MECQRWQTHTHPFNSPLFRNTQVSRYQKGKTNLDFTEAKARDGEGIYRGTFTTQHRQVRQYMWVPITLHGCSHNMSLY